LNRSSTFFDYINEIPDSQHAPIEDEQLLVLTAQNDEMAFAELYKRYNQPVFNYLYRLVNGLHEAEDLLQEVFLIVWKGAAGFRGDARVKTWIFRIAHHRAVSWLRQRKPVVKLDETNLKDWQNNPEQTAAQSLRDRQIQETISQLSWKHRAVLELVFVQQMSYSETAQVLGCPLGTVKSRMSYAMRILEQRFKQDGVTGESI
jgi:RNA polymerase sigma-70 factor (ECF subfamily)